MLLPNSSEPVREIGLRFFGDRITTLPLPEAKAEDALLHRRQPLVAVAVSKSLLRDTRVAVVGLSGGGSQVATQLGVLGVGEIIGIDAQRVASDNLVATDGFSWADALLRKRKTAAV
jgi:molybdopterin/thiamine biosynthesis adenylyltransferase